ncbi:MAG: hypothetical protein ACFFAE_02060 [Candidatus Hodarchaeota archaeon]
MSKKSQLKKDTKVQTRNLGAVIILIIAGIFIIEGNVIGGPGIFGLLGNVIVEQGYIAETNLINLVTSTIYVFGLIGSLGGIAVFMGAGFIFFYRKMLGKLVVNLGTGMGLIGLFILFITTYLAGAYAVLGLILLIIHSVGWIGIFLSIYGTRLVK